MQVSVSDIPVILGKYVDAEIAPKADSVRRFGIYGFLFVIQNKVNQFLEPYSPALSAAGVLVENGTMIDLDVGYEMAKFAMEKTGKVELFGYLMDMSDIESLYAIAKGFAR